MLKNFDCISSTLRSAYCCQEREVRAWPLRKKIFFCGFPKCVCVLSLNYHVLEIDVISKVNKEEGYFNLAFVSLKLCMFSS